MSVDVNFIVSTVLAAHQVGATPQQRAAEVQLFYQVRSVIFLSLSLSVLMPTSTLANHSHSVPPTLVVEFPWFHRS